MRIYTHTSILIKVHTYHQRAYHSNMPYKNATPVFGEHNTFRPCITCRAWRAQKQPWRRTRAGSLQHTVHWAMVHALLR